MPLFAAKVRRLAKHEASRALEHCLNFGDGNRDGVGASCRHVRIRNFCVMIVSCCASTRSEGAELGARRDALAPLRLVKDKHAPRADTRQSVLSRQTAGEKCAISGHAAALSQPGEHVHGVKLSGKQARSLLSRWENHVDILAAPDGRENVQFWRRCQTVPGHKGGGVNVGSQRGRCQFWPLQIKLSTKHDASQ